MSSYETRQTTSRKKVVAGCLLFVVVLNVIAWLAGWFAPEPGGPRSSSFATGADGLAAYSELLGRNGLDVEQLRQPIEDIQASADTTLVVLDPGSLSVEQTSSLRDFVSRGGRLVAGGAPARWLNDLVPGLEWDPEPLPTAEVLAPTVETTGVVGIRSAGGGSFSSYDGALPLLGNDDRALAVVAMVGRGEVVALADSSPLHNEYLDESDNAAFGVALAGDSRSVSFAESIHGYGATGLGALPASWKWALTLAGVAAIVFIAARFRRLGPPEEPASRPPPPRIAYVNALAGILARTKQTNWAHARLRNRTGDQR
jgi:hypothetical protein